MSQFKEPLLYADLTFYPMTEKQIENVLNKEVLAIYDNYYEFTPDELENLYKEHHNAFKERYSLLLLVLRKEPNTDEYRWYEKLEDPTEDIGTKLKSVVYYAFKPQLKLQNGSVSDIQINRNNYEN